MNSGGDQLLSKIFAARKSLPSDDERANRCRCTSFRLISSMLKTLISMNFELNAIEKSLETVDGLLLENPISSVEAQNTRFGPWVGCDSGSPSW